MKNLKNKLIKISSSVMFMILLLQTKAFAIAAEINNLTTGLRNTVYAAAKPIASFLIFVSVIIIGFEVIVKRNNADERSQSMTSLMWLGIGALIIGSAMLIWGMFGVLIENPTAGI